MMENIYLERENRLYGRTVIAADSIAALVYDNPSVDNASALQSIADRVTRDVEIIEFPENKVIYTDQVQLKSNLYWRSAGQHPVTFKQKARHFAGFGEYGVLRIDGQDDGSLENLIVDFDRASHTYEGNTGGIDTINGSFAARWMLWSVHVKRSKGDSIDWDDSHDCLHVFCSVQDGSKDGFQNSGGVYNNRHYFCHADRIYGEGTLRGGFTSHERSTGRNSFYFCTASNSLRGFQIVQKDHASPLANDILVGCQSIYCQLPDILTGQATGTPPVVVGANPTMTIDLNNPPNIGLVHFQGASLNQPPPGGGGALQQTRSLTTGLINSQMAIMSGTGHVFVRMNTSSPWRRLKYADE